MWLKILHTESSFSQQKVLAQTISNAQSDAAMGDKELLRLRSGRKIPGHRTISAKALGQERQLLFDRNWWECPENEKISDFKRSKRGEKDLAWESCRLGSSDKGFKHYAIGGASKDPLSSKKDALEKVRMDSREPEILELFRGELMIASAAGSSE